MITTDVQAKLLSYQMTRKYFSDDPEKFTAVLQDAKVDLNPHQVDAALFAFKSPFSKGAILADEVGLGKTIEAGLVISQKWAEGQRKMIIIAPASLRKQWSMELMDKFYLPSIILEAKSFNSEINRGNFNPFDQEKIIIVSYNFAKSKISYIKAVAWDLVVIDEAHRLRNAYRTDNKTARCLKENLMPFKKLLLTATPLQNSLMELYSLVSFIDSNIFGDISSYKQNYVKSAIADNSFEDLKHRLKPIVYRTLRKNVLEYVKYTNRIPITESFEPNKKEQELYDCISEYLKRDTLNALPNSQRTLITLVMRKLLASSTFAITDTLKSLIEKLERYYAKLYNKPCQEREVNLFDEDMNDLYLEDVDEEEDEVITEKEILLDEEAREKKAESIQEEIKELQKYLKLAESIKYNAKGKSLLLALEKGFSTLSELGANKKAVIFTESKRTQEYVQMLLEGKGYNVALFNGSNSDKKSKEIYNEWLEKNKNTSKISGSITADKRAALVDYFREKADILIATEAAAEGINLQFCSLVVNYDLPWNPQRIEQRIGRCHRYGQKNDVVVINFLNNKNTADVRVYELLSQKFKLFEGVFGSSDEVLGSIESGIDFEKKINEIYQTCRTQEEINLAFDRLSLIMDNNIRSTMETTRQKLLEHFDEEVNEKLRVNFTKSINYVDNYSKNLWDITKYVLKDRAEFYDNETMFKVNNYSHYTGLYSLNANDACYTYRAEHYLAKDILKEAKEYNTENQELIFDLTNHNGKVTVLEKYKGKSGTISVYNLSIEGIENESYLLYGGTTDSGEVMSKNEIERLFRLPAVAQHREVREVEDIENILERNKSDLLDRIEQRNSIYFDEEMDKIERWCKDLKDNLETKIKKMDLDIRMMKAEAKKQQKLSEKLELNKKIKDLEAKRNKLRFELYEEQDKLDELKDSLIDRVSERLKQSLTYEKVFTIKWSLV